MYMYLYNVYLMSKFTNEVINNIPGFVKEGNREEL